jgi:hypothetical protein
MKKSTEKRDSNAMNRVNGVLPPHKPAGVTGNNLLDVEVDETVVGTKVKRGRKAKAEKTEAPAIVSVPALDIRLMTCRIVGDASLIVHKFSEKTKRQMADKQMQKASLGRQAKDPQEDFENSLHRLPDGPKGKKRYGFPAIAFKCAAVTACTSLNKALSKTAARQAFHVIGDMVEIEGDPSMREDMVRVGPSKSADIRYRGEFKTWSCILKIRYNARVFSMEQIVNLLNTAGFGVGIGEWRPEKNGQNGLFHVE